MKVHSLLAKVGTNPDCTPYTFGNRTARLTLSPSDTIFSRVINRQVYIQLKVF